MKRLLPDTMRARFTITLTLVCITLVAVMYVAMSQFMRTSLNEFAQNKASLHASAFALFLDQQAERLDGVVGGYAEWDEFYTQTNHPDRTWVDSEVRSWLAEKTHERALLWLNDKGDTVLAMGSAADLAVLRTAALKTTKARFGLIGLPSGPAVTSIRPIIGFPARPDTGIIAVAEQVDATMLKGFEGSSDGLRADFSARSQVTGFTLIPTHKRAMVGRTWTRTQGDRVDTLIELIDVNSVAFARALVSERDAFFARSAAAQQNAALLAIGLALVAALILTLGLVRAIDRPLTKFARALKTQGAAAIDGEPWSSELLTGGNLPREFREIGRTADDLLTDLSLHQEQLKRAVEQTERAEDELESVVNGSSEAKLLIENDIVRVANPAVTACFGVSARRITGRAMRESMRELEFTLDDDSIVRWPDLVTRAFEQWVTTRLTIAGRGERWLAVRATYPQTNNEDLVLVTARDVSDTHELEELRAELLSMVTHDLRTPLTVITGYLDLLRGNLPEAMRDRAVDSAHASAERMAGMLEDLLEATRSQEVFAPKVFDPINFLELASDTLASLQETTSTHMLRVEGLSDVVVFGEAGRLRQAITNLVTNAIKYSPKDTTVTVTVGRHAGTALLYVDDEGPGIPEEHRTDVFQRFTRLEGADQVAKGFGVGLHIVRIVVETHGGHVHIEEAPGGGARFVIELPASNGTGASPEELDPRD